MRSLATFTWQTLLAATGGTCASHHRGFDRAAVDTDTRTLDRGTFFIPLRGANFDGHEYLEQAYEKGVEGAFTTIAHLDQNSQLRRFPNLIAVADPLAAYLALANVYRRGLPVKVVAITGSSGKTTTKEMLYTMLAARLGERVQKSDKNHNNEVGVAQTLLQLRPDTQVAVVEMGMRGRHQIDILSIAAEPDIGLITNVGPAHIGLLGSLQEIALAKCELFAGMSPTTGLGIVNGDDPLLMKQVAQSWSGPVETFSLHDVDNIHTRKEGRIEFEYDTVPFQLGLPGAHNVMNALACVKTCEALGLPLKPLANSLAGFEAGGGRWNKAQIDPDANLWIINDAYNANPASVKVALGAFMDARMPDLKKVAILGGMAELGDFSQMYHGEIGTFITQHTGLDALIVVGEDARPIAEAVPPQQLATYAVADLDAVAALIREHWPRDAIFFLKASRAFRLDALPAMLVHTPQEANSHGVS